MNAVQKNDINAFVQGFELSEQLTRKKFLVTGATGLIGSTLVRCLLSMNRGIEITIPVRSKAKAATIFGENESLHIVECDLVNWIRNLDESFDYVIHCASPTAGKYMVEHPVETYELAIESTKALLNYGRMKSVKSLVYVSSLESYGQIMDDHMISETDQGYIDIFSSRSSYPMGKRAAEYLCFAYSSEYDVPIKIARLTQTFGAGVAVDDSRVFAQFARSVIGNSDIVMHTKGESAKPYCYTTDCISAILYILLKGANGEAYNVANPSTYISIRGLAEFLCENFNPQIKVVVKENLEMGYAPVTKLNLSVEKLLSLGWRPRYNLREMFSRLIDSMR